MSTHSMIPGALLGLFIVSFGAVKDCLAKPIDTTDYPVVDEKYLETVGRFVKSDPADSARMSVRMALTEEELKDGASVSANEDET